MSPNEVEKLGNIELFLSRDFHSFLRSSSFYLFHCEGKTKNEQKLFCCYRTKRSTRLFHSYIALHFFSISILHCSSPSDVLWNKLSHLLSFVRIFWMAKRSTQRDSRKEEKNLISFQDSLFLSLAIF